MSKNRFISEENVKYILNLLASNPTSKYGYIFRIVDNAVVVTAYI